jgi:phage terminase large subunit
MIDIDFKNIDKIINPSFYPLLKNKSRYLLIYGGSGSGKSIFALQKMILRCLLNKEKFLFMRKYSVDCRKTVFSLTKYLLEKYNLNSICKIKESSMTIDFMNGSQIIHVGCDDPEKIKSIPNITSIWCEESTDFNEEDIQQLSLRLRGEKPNYFQIIMTFNPISINHWIHKNFFENEINNYTIHHSTYIDNKFLDDEYINVLNDIKDSTLKEIYQKGLWGILENQIFKNYEIIESIDNKLFNIENMRYGIDFGFHNCILLRTGFYKNNIYILDELHKKDMTSIDFMEKCSESIINKRIPIVADCEDPSTIELFRKNKLLIKPCKKNKNSIQDSINWLKNRNIYIHKDCKNIIEEISSYVYKKDNKTNISYDEPDSKCKDHSLDALRYSMEDFIRPFKMEYSIGKKRESASLFS